MKKRKKKALNVLKKNQKKNRSSVFETHQSSVLVHSRLAIVCVCVCVCVCVFVECVTNG
jgi:hypothetical protein